MNVKISSLVKIHQLFAKIMYSTNLGEDNYGFNLHQPGI